MLEVLEIRESEYLVIGNRCTPLFIRVCGKACLRGHHYRWCRVIYEHVPYGEYLSADTNRYCIVRLTKLNSTFTPLRVGFGGPCIFPS